MKKFFLICLISLLTLCNTVSAKDFQTCCKYFDGQNYVAARDCSAPLVKLNPSDARMRYLYAMSLKYTQEYEKSSYQFNYIIKQSPNTQLASMAQQEISEIKQRVNKAANANKTDCGNYMNELSNPPRWATMPIKVWIQPSKYDVTVVKAFNEWQYVTNGIVRFTRTQAESQAKIKVYFVNSKEPLGGSDRVGLCKYQTQGKYLMNAQISILTQSLNGVTLSASQIYPVTLHEIGHAIGINGHSSNNNDVMFANTDIIGSHTSRRDVNTVKAIYGK